MFSLISALFHFSSERSTTSSICAQPEFHKRLRTMVCHSCRKSSWNITGIRSEVSFKKRRYRTPSKVDGGGGGGGEMLIPEYETYIFIKARLKCCPVKSLLGQDLETETCNKV